MAMVSRTCMLPGIAEGGGWAKHPYRCDSARGMGCNRVCVLEAMRDHHVAVATRLLSLRGLKRKSKNN